MNENGPANHQVIEQVIEQTIAQVAMPVRGFVGGFSSFIAGCRWLGRHPAWLVLLLVPFVFGIMTFSAGVWAFFEYNADLYDYLLFKRPEESWKLAIWFALKGVVGVALFLFVLGASVVVAAILASPVFDRVSLAVERDVLGPAFNSSPAPVFSLRLAVDEFKKGLISVCLPLFVLLIPGLNVLTPLVTALVLGWNLYDYPFARRGLPLSGRIGLALRDAPALTGLGVWLIFPLAQIFLMPFAIVGATMIACDRLRHSEVER